MENPPYSYETPEERQRRETIAHWIAGLVGVVAIAGFASLLAKAFRFR